MAKHPHSPLAAVRSRTTLLLSFLTVMSLVGCVRFEPKPLTPERGALALDARRLDSPELQQALQEAFPGKRLQWPLTTWDLDTLTVAAFYFNPSLEVARAQWR